MRTCVAFGVVLCALVGIAVPAHAAEGRIPIYAPGPITTNGTFVLTRDIVGNGTTHAIEIQAMEVDIDLNGHSISNASGQDCIYVSVPYARLTVRNGVLSACHSGVFANVAGLVVLEDVKIRDTWGSSIVLDAVPAIAIRRLEASGIGSVGIVVSGTGPHNAEITDCTIRGAASDGIVFSNGTPTIRGNRITDSAGVGLWLFGALGGVISGNSVEGSGGSAGMELIGSYGNVVDGNAVRSSDGHGIHVAADSRHNQIRNNVSALNGMGLSGQGHGLLVDGWMNQIEQNTLTGNSSAGLYFGTSGCGNGFGRNMARNNAGTGVPAECNGVPPLFPPNSCNTCTADVNSTFGDNLIPGPPIF